MAPAAPPMTSQGSAQAGFQRAIKRGHVLHAEIAARELGSLSIADALALVLLYHREGDAKFERAARRWVRRVQIDHSLRREEVELLRSAMGALGSRFLLRHVGNCDYRSRRSRRNLGATILYSEQSPAETLTPADPGAIFLACES